MKMFLNLNQALTSLCRFDSYASSGLFVPVARRALEKSRKCSRRRGRSLLVCGEFLSKYRHLDTHSIHWSTRISEESSRVPLVCLVHWCLVTSYAFVSNIAMTFFFLRPVVIFSGRSQNVSLAGVPPERRVLPTEKPTTPPPTLPPPTCGAPFPSLQNSTSADSARLQGSEYIAFNVTREILDYTRRRWVTILVFLFFFPLEKEWWCGHPICNLPRLKSRGKQK